MGRAGRDPTATHPARRQVTWSDWIDEQLEGLRAADRWRQCSSFDARGPTGTLAGGREVVSFASNDYLGLSAHPALVAAAHEALDRWGTGSGASRLVVGSRPVHHELEEALAAWKGTPAAVVFPTGYAANTGLLSTLAAPDVTIVSDELNHASIIDGCRLAARRGAEVLVYAHADAGRAEQLVAGAARRGRRVVLVTDGVFSMDGDVAPWSDLAGACARHGALAVVDEAHVVIDPLPDVEEAEVVRVGTLSKALGSLGGFVAGSRAVVDLLVNRARPFVFTTAPTPADTAAALEAVRLLGSEEGTRLVERLRGHVHAFKPGHRTPVVPVVVGAEADALRLAESLLDHGMLVPAIRPPTVAPGTSRLRVALSAGHTSDQVATLRAVLDDLIEHFGTRDDRR